MTLFHIPNDNLVLDGRSALKKHLNIGIPVKFDESVLAGLGVYVVQFDPKPIAQSDEIAEQNALPAHSGGISTLGWTVRSKTTEELASDAQASRTLMIVNPTPFAMAAEELGVITLAEATDWLEQNSLPAFIIAAVTAQFSDAQTSQVTDQAGLDRALLRLRNLEMVRRLGSFIEVLRLARGYTHEFVDQIFERAAQIQETL